MSRRRGATLAERSAAPGSTAHRVPGPPTGPPAEPPAPPPEATAAAATDSPASRHCWVRDLPGFPGRWPGVLLEWRVEPGPRWSGRVAYAVLDDGRTVLVEGWVPAGHLEPA